MRRHTAWPRLRKLQDLSRTTVSTRTPDRLTGYSCYSPRRPKEVQAVTDHQEQGQSKATSSETRCHDLGADLGRFCDAWSNIRFKFEGPPPQASSSYDDWSEQISRNLIIQNSESNDFPAAWQRAVASVREEVYTKLIPWSCRTLQTFGLPSLSLIPSPPTNIIPTVAAFEDKVLTADLVDSWLGCSSGMRPVIFR